VLEKCQCDPQYAAILSCVDAATARWVRRAPPSSHVGPPPSLSLTENLLRQAADLLGKMEPGSTRSELQKRTKEMMIAARAAKDSARESELLEYSPGALSAPMEPLSR
jgi:hypothetical protein